MSFLPENAGVARVGNYFPSRVSFCVQPFLVPGHKSWLGRLNRVVVLPLACFRGRLSLVGDDLGDELGEPGVGADWVSHRLYTEIDEAVHALLVVVGQ
jgi:hypothetical protein